MPPTRPAEERFWEKVNRTDGCWLWTAGTNNRGYGVFYPVHGKHALAHRFVYELTVRPLGPDEKIDHHYLCPKTCVNPAHLRPVTQKQNLENRAGAQSNNRSSGVRGVTWDKRNRKWQVQAKHNRKQYYGGYFDTIAEAEAAAIALRNRLFTHNDADRHD
jgi:hypothetical protein